MTAGLVLSLPTNGIKDVVDRNIFGSYVITIDGKVYSWGQGTSGSNGNGSIAINVRAGLVQGFPPPQMILGDSAIPPVSTTPNGNFNERVYSVNRIPIGETLEIVYKGKVNRADVSFNVLNQAYVNGPTTPISGLLK